jgi:FixJ family two-component response regulator
LYAEATAIVCQTGNNVKQSPTVFVVDDRPQVLESLKAIFKAHGYTVECFASSAEFIADQGPNQAGCVIVDPLMNPSGRTVLQWLHKSDSLLSIVLISGLIASADRVQQASVPRISESPYEIWVLLTMVADGLAGSLSRKSIRDRGRLRG